MKRAVLIWVIAVLTICKGSAQCTGPTPEPPGLCTGILATDGVNINSGDEYYYSGPATTFNSLYVNNGTLRVCGELTVLNFVFNSGKIVIEPGGIFRMGQDASTKSSPQQQIINYGILDINLNYNLNSDCYLINFGTVNIATETRVTGLNAYFINEPLAKVNMAGYDLILNSTFINGGDAEFRNLTVNAGNVCMGPSATLEVQNIINNPNNSFIVESGTTCFGYAGSATLNGTLTASPNFILCQKAGASAPSPPNTGSAQVISCTSCKMVLPVELISFSASLSGTQYQLQWESGMEDNLKSYIIETSTDGRVFQTNGNVSAKGIPSQYHFPIAVNSKTYFRLKMVDNDGRYEYSRVISVDPAAPKSQLLIAPNPILNGRLELRINLPGPQAGEFKIYNMHGTIVSQKMINLQTGSHYIVIPVGHLSAGLYKVIFQSEKISMSANALINRN